MVMVLPEANLVIRDSHLRSSIRSRNLEDGIVRVIDSVGAKTDSDARQLPQGEG